MKTAPTPYPVKQRYYQKDLQDWADYVGVKIGMPPVFPVNSVKVMRGAFIAIEAGCIVPYVRLAFERYWSELRDISADNEIEEIVEAVGLDRVEFWGKVTSPAYKDKLRLNTNELIERGGYGSPTFFLNRHDMYFGNDRIPLIARKLSG